MAKNNGRETFRKVITSPELTAQINKDNIKFMERYLKNFATKHSPKSVTDLSKRAGRSFLMGWDRARKERADGRTVFGN